MRAGATVRRSLWLREALAGADDAPRLEGAQLADVCRRSTAGWSPAGVAAAWRVR